MIAFIIGNVVEMDENTIVLEQNHMGFCIYVPADVINYVRIGEEIKLHTYLHVKEDLMQLYGFLTTDDLQLFKLLLGVNGIGPKGALGILSVLSADDLRFAVLSDDSQSIAKAPGIGKKTAQKLILELKDKLSLEEAFEQKLKNRAAANEAVNSASQIDEAVMALVSLGYPNSDALRAVRKVSGAEDMNVEQILKAALKQL